jgi:hypothetical protein
MNLTGLLGYDWPWALAHGTSTPASARKYAKRRARLISGLDASVDNTVSRQSSLEVRFFPTTLDHLVKNSGKGSARQGPIGSQVFDLATNGVNFDTVTVVHGANDFRTYGHQQAPAYAASKKKPTKRLGDNRQD